MSTSLDFILVRRSAVEYLKKNFPALCETSGLCELVAGRLYTVTTLHAKEHDAPVQITEGWIPVGEVIENVIGVEVAWISTRTKPPAGTKLYAELPPPPKEGK